MTEKKDDIGFVQGVKNLITNTFTPGKAGSFYGAAEEAEKNVKFDAGHKNPMPKKPTSALGRVTVC